jgi:hypothetical protein
MIGAMVIGAAIVLYLLWQEWGATVTAAAANAPSAAPHSPLVQSEIPDQISSSYPVLGAATVGTPAFSEPPAPAVGTQTTTSAPVTGTMVESLPFLRQ